MIRILPGGYNSQVHNGHAVLYRISKIEGKYIFSIINSGEGAFVYDNKAYILRIKNLSLEQIINPTLWVELQKFYDSSTMFVKDISMKDIIETIRQHLKGEIDFEYPHSIQINGTCSYSCILTLIEMTLEPQLFHVFELFLIQSGYLGLEALNKRLNIDDHIAKITCEDEERGKMLRGHNY